MALIQPVEDGKIPKDTSTTSKSDTSNDLGYDQFLQLLCAEMQYQDPLEPTSNTEYVAQLATFSQMEATLGMQSTIESSNANALVLSRQHLRLEKQQQHRDLLIMYRKKTVSRRSV